MERKLNLGCGNQTPKNWINVDYALGAKIAKIPLLSNIRLTRIKWQKGIVIHNLIKPLPWKSNSIDVIYSSHTLEHLTRQDGYNFLQECYRVIKPGGIIRIVVPDLKIDIKKYIEGYISADNFLENLLVLYPSGGNFIKNLFISKIYSPHKCMYDIETLVTILEKIGFKVKECAAFESLISDINNIELLSRTKDSIIAEGIK